MVSHGLYLVARWFIARRATLSLRRNGPKARDRRRPIPNNTTPLRSAEMIMRGIIVEPGYLKVDLFRPANGCGNARRSSHPSRLRRASASHRRSSYRFMLRGRYSKVEQYGLPEYFKELGESKCRIALTGDSDELRLSQQYIQVLARRNGSTSGAFPTNKRHSIGSKTGDDGAGPARATGAQGRQEQRQHRPRRNQESISLGSSGGMSA